MLVVLVVTCIYFIFATLYVDSIVDIFAKVGGGGGRPPVVILIQLYLKITQGSSTSGSHETATKRSYARWSTSGTLSRSRAAQARLTRAIRERPPYVSAHESHRPALELLRATVRGSPDMRGAVHQPTALVCWQVRGARRAPMAQILRHYRGGARHAPPVSPVDETGAAPTTRVRLLSTAQPDHRLHSMRGRRLSGAAVEAAVDGCQVAASGNLVAASRGSRRPPSCYRGAAPVAGRPMPEARTAASRRAS